MKKSDKASDTKIRMEQGFNRKIQTGGLSEKQAGVSASRFLENQGRVSAEIVFTPERWKSGFGAVTPSSLPGGLARLCWEEMALYQDEF